MRFGSLFSGVGGFDLGLERAGHECAWQVEYDKQARAVLRRHWPNVDLYEDVRDVGSTTLAPVDLICGGFPCQDLSVAGRRAGLDGERSGLWFEFHRIVSELAPRWVLIENVPGLLSSNGGADLAVILRGLAELGYVGAWRVVDSQHFGVAQRRKRVFLLACRDPGGASPAEILAIPEGLSGHPVPGREAGEEVAGTLGGRAAGEGGQRNDLDNHGAYPLANTLPTKYRGDPHEGTDTLVAHTLRAEGFDASEDGTGRGTPLVIQEAQTGTRLYEKAGTLRADAPGSQPGGSLVFGWNKSASQTMRVDGETTDALQASETSNPAVLPFDTTQITSKANRSHPKAGDPCHPLAAGAHPPSIAPLLEVGARTNSDGNRDGDRIGEPGDPMYSLQASKQHGVAPVGCDLYNGSQTGDIAATLGANTGQSASHSGPSVLAAIPRRLTPTECERLQAFPDGWTEWGVDDEGNRVEMADGPRYRMMGNAVTVNVAHWIGRRLMEAHAKQQEQAA